MRSSRRATVERHLVWCITSDHTTRHGHCRGSLSSVLCFDVCFVRFSYINATANDAPFLTKLISRSLFPGVPDDLAHQAQRLSEVLNAGSGVSSETCPACAAEIPINEWNNATCVNGHVWGKYTVL